MLVNTQKQAKSAGATVKHKQPIRSLEAKTNDQYSSIAKWFTQVPVS
jgi:hypothetical protein